MSHAKQLHNRRYLHDYLEIINREGLPGHIKHDLCLKVQATVIATVQHVIEAALDEERSAYLGLARYEQVPWGRSPESPRSGSSQRVLRTPYGPMAALHVPKLRRGNGAWTWHSLTRYERCWGPLRDQQGLRYCLGHSLRDWQETMALPRGADTQTLGQAGQDPHDEVHRGVFAVEEGAMRFRKIALARRTVELPPGATTGMTVGS